MATFTNQATLSYNNTITTSNTTTGELLEVLSVTKTALSGTYTPRDNAVYVISLVNSGSSALTGLTVSDDLGAYAFNTTTLTPMEYVTGSLRAFQNGALQTAPTVTAGPPLTISGVSVPAGGNTVLIYETRLNQYAPADTESSIVNTVTVTGDALASALTAEATINAAVAPYLTISKSLSPLTVAENGRVTYTFLIQNTGNTAVTAADSAAITDTFTPALRDLTVSFNGTAWTAGTDYTYDTTTGLFTTVAGRIVVPAATFAQNADGAWVTTPGTATLTVSGTI